MESKVAYAIITDGTTVAVIQHNGYYDEGLYLELFLTTASDVPVRRVIAGLLFSSAHNQKLVRVYDKGH